MKEMNKTTPATKQPEKEAPAADPAKENKAAAGADVVIIDIDNIQPHPDNPRKELGDLSEMAESIKKNGIMQNLTVIPDTDHPGKYFSLIGHRRHAAAKLAGIHKAPCRIIEGLTKKEQVGIMLEENMQRADLTIYEQAQGFQMMLDLGETKETIADKTGFSLTTINHRLNIAKLDKRTLKAREKDEAFQLAISDLYELEKVADIKKRNQILKEARDSRDLAFRAKQAAADEKRDKAAAAIVEMCEKRGIAKAENYADHRWDGTWLKVKVIDLNEPTPKRLRIGEEEGAALFWARDYREIVIVKKNDKKGQKRELTAYEKERQEIDKRRKTIKAIYKKTLAGIRDFIKTIIDGKTEDIKDTAELLPLLWDALVANETFLNRNRLSVYITGKDAWKLTEEEKNKAQAIIGALPMVHQMLILLTGAIDTLEMADYNGYFKKATRKSWRRSWRRLRFTVFPSRMKLKSRWRTAPIRYTS